jgi:carbonic anhydrase/acetyltransferase-like protein (isoleucine patch superfamily)
MELVTPRIDPTAFIAPNAHVYGDVSIAAGAVVMFGVVIRAEVDRVTVGERTNLQDGVIVHVDRGVPCDIGHDVTVGHGAIVHGATVGAHCLVGIGARALNGSVMGEGSWLAAGSLLPEGKSIPPWTLAVGTPAKPLRALRQDEIERQRNGVADYVEFGTLYGKLFAADAGGR